jgi:hypothetical protein
MIAFILNFSSSVLKGYDLTIVGLLLKSVYILTTLKLALSIVST